MNGMEITKQLKCDIDFNQTELTNAIRKHQVRFYCHKFCGQHDISNFEDALLQQNYHKVENLCHTTAFRN